MTGGVRREFGMTYLPCGCRGGSVVRSGRETECDDCHGPIVRGELAVREGRVSTEHGLSGRHCLTCAHRIGMVLDEMANRHPEHVR